MNSDVFDDTVEQRIAFGIATARRRIEQSEAAWKRYANRVLQTINKIELLLSKLEDLTNRYPTDGDDATRAAWADAVYNLLSKKLDTDG